MPKITIFNVWEIEAQNYINELTTLAQGAIDQQALTDWLHEEGIIIFQTKFKKHIQAVKAQEEKVVKPPMTFTANQITEAYLDGFLELKTKLHEEFKITNHVGHNKFHDAFNKFINAAMKHEAYFQLRAMAYSAVNQRSVENPKLTMADAEAAVDGVYSAVLAVTSDESLKADIRNTHAFALEYTRLLAAKSATTVTKPAVTSLSTQTFFRHDQRANESIAIALSVPTTKMDIQRPQRKPS